MDRRVKTFREFIQKTRVKYFYLDLFGVGEAGSSSESEMQITLLSCGEAACGGAKVSCPTSVFISDISELKVSHVGFSSSESSAIVSTAKDHVRRMGFVYFWYLASKRERWIEQARFLASSPFFLCAPSMLPKARSQLRWLCSPCKFLRNTRPRLTR